MRKGPVLGSSFKKVERTCTTCGKVEYVPTVTKSKNCDKCREERRRTLNNIRNKNQRQVNPTSYISPSISNQEKLRRSAEKRIRLAKEERLGVVTLAELDASRKDNCVCYDHCRLLAAKAGKAKVCPEECPKFHAKALKLLSEEDVWQGGIDCSAW